MSGLGGLGDALDVVSQHDIHNHPGYLESLGQWCRLSRRPARLISSVYSRTPTFAPSTPSVSPSCWPGESVARKFKLN